ncbi:urease accessory protein UreE [Balneatrix alpica]|uniref:urease accessory protein UreE n=1 Tax=Balneatrix alpica TaxID=75684 RepID=UPI002739D141|nr:urease accessory protein UreE [Balneatrix alpica]
MLELTDNLQPAAVQPQDELTLSFEQRQKARFRALTDAGRDVGVFVRRGQVLQEGTLLASSEGVLVRVKAQVEPLCEARCEDWLSFAKACYHLGNRHVPLQVGERWLRFQPDHVLEDMLLQLGLQLSRVQAPFNPERGAYQGAAHSHGHSHSHGHQHG